MCANTWFKKNEKRIVTFNLGGNQTEINFVLLEKERTKFLKDAKVIHWELQHSLVVIDVKKENLFKRMRIKRNMQCRVWKFKEEETRKKFKDKAKEFVN